MSIPLSGAPFGHLRPTYEARQLFQEKRQFCLVLRQHFCQSRELRGVAGVVALVQGVPQVLPAAVGGGLRNLRRRHGHTLLPQIVVHLILTPGRAGKALNITMDDTPQQRRAGQ
jgi:hypothetical protein